MDDDQNGTADAYEAQARAAIRADLDDGDAVSEFLDTSLNEIDSDYWIEHFGTADPTPEAVIAGLEMGWAQTDDEDEDIWHSVDFSLPGSAGDGVLVVRFGKDGAVSDVELDS